jgi:hypothetical protein
MGMTTFRLPNARGTQKAQKVQWQHLLFVKGTHAISCDVDLRSDGQYAATLFPLWAPDDHVTEMFRRSGEAMRWHQEMANRLQASGWLLFEANAVTSAA